MAVREKTNSQLFESAITGKSDDLAELSGRAFGGNQEAQKLIGKIESMNIRIVDEIKPDGHNKPGIIRKILQPIVDLAGTKVRQIMVGCDLEQAPPLYEPGCTQEEFPNLPLLKAHGILMRARKRQMNQPGEEKVSVLNGGGVPSEAWSKADQILMLRGEKPRGVPLHPNI